MHETDANRRIDRRTLLTATAAGTLALAGCAGDDGGDDDEGETNDEAEFEDLAVGPEFLEIEDPPDAVYLPTHRESMRTYDPIDAGDYTLAPMVSYPHPFWIVAGGAGEDNVAREEPDDGRGVHVMVTLWDEATGVVLPVDDGATLRLYKDGEQVGSPRSPWAMLSQEMGFHFGDNVSLPEDGTYTVEVDLPPLATQTTGDLEGRFDESATARFEFVYDDEFRHEVADGVDYLDEEEWGRRDALEPMDHGGHGHGSDHGKEHEHHSGEHDDHEGGDEHQDHAHVPYSALPAIDDYPDRLLVSPDDGRPDEHEDLPRSGDAAVLATLFESGFRLADGDEQYLLVSPRTPYNRVPLADASLSATIERDGDTVADDIGLGQTIDGEYDHHYGVSVANIEPGDSVTVTVESPPQVARHQGYETAFLEMPAVELEVLGET
ncbi:DUF7350 domain-containing protein [Natronobacterium gregoryi]|uniref:DUF7350 domain-containing protein n=2 Tax=Natronobacterium gregoryi TaxID=44930 RepID=L0AC37_NATGS|nr:hypothetical protein [Natronobacterium gregoryi]AFZ71468.1 hypothetical protein Natgr_0207 [Natronobacterium gregoryi SP2]ELY66770.1 hypothetical protein C490_12175 [Natronobacterium gregoryi SP2]PLK19938.1 hypothetical protein CYV19_12065 [Natronobacterium gregoryi SP2]SFJ36435.1 hypothetical protein SAMN05443661_12439 [Natronobacterium gregoryi]